MARRLPLRSGMRTLFLVCLLLAPAIARGQDAVVPDGARIGASEVSGIALDQLSPGLRAEIASLAGSTLSQQQLRGLADRIEGEQPGTVAAVRAVAQPAGDVRIVFLVARIDESQTLQANINARYVIERVEITGIDTSTIDARLRDDLQALTGRQMDPAEVERLERALDASLPEHQVRRRIERGTEPGNVTVILEVTPQPRSWIPFTRTRSNLVYHAYQGWGGALDAPFGSRNHQFTIGGVVNDEDTLVEQYSGWRFRFEGRELATARLGASIEFSTLRQTWREATLDAIASNGLPRAYRARRTIEPVVTFAFTPSVRVRGGVSVSDLESLSTAPDAQMASALVAGLAVNHRWQLRDGGVQQIAGSYEMRRGLPSLNSDLAYTRQSASFFYRMTRGRSSVTSRTSAGRISGDAPMFERFTLGDTRTLRGWNKYDLAPAGASRQLHHALDYRFSHYGVFLDSGAVWEPDADVDVRLSTGATATYGPLFFTFGVPINADRVRVAFMSGFRLELEF